MKNYLTLISLRYFIPFLLSLVLLLPVKHSMAQQRSAYDLAAWIIAAVDYYDTTNINWALQQGGQIDFKRAGMNALELAIANKKTAMVKFLLDKGASVDSVNQDGMNALQFAQKKGEPKIIKMIRAKMKTNNNEVPEQNTIVNNKKAEVINTPESSKPNIYKVGDRVLHSRDRGKTWEPGIIKEISNNKRSLEDGLPPYLVENSTKTSQNYLDPNFITTLNRQHTWTSFFVGDWNLQLPIAAVEREIDGDVYRVFSGGDRLPPLRIKADGTYSWVIDKNNVIKGKWKQKDDAPGIWLLKGYRGINWLVYNTTDNNNLKIYKKDYIIIADPKGDYISNHGFRITKGGK